VLHVMQHMTSATQILVGLVSGVIVGLFCGEHAGVLKAVLITL
jgi:Na+/H+-dicarboxylate symporter